MAYPVIQDINPNVESPIAENSILQFSVTDPDSNLARVAVTAIYSNGDQEVVFDGNAFSARYIVNSMKTVIPDGLRFRILRAGKWAENPIIRVLAMDGSFNILEQDLKWLTLALNKPLASFYQNAAKSTTSSSVGDVVLQEVKEGLLQPFARDGKGDLAHGGGVLLIGASIRQILGTICKSGDARGELEWMPEFGSLLDRLRHEPADIGTLELARLRVVSALGTFEPRVRVKWAKCDYVRDADGRYALRININYDVLNAKTGTPIVENVNGVIQ